MGELFLIYSDRIVDVVSCHSKILFLIFDIFHMFGKHTFHATTKAGLKSP